MLGRRRIVNHSPSEVLLLLLAILVFPGSDTVLAIGESSDVYDARYGRPVEVTESRGYATAEWAVYVHLTNGRTRAVTYMRTASNSGAGGGGRNLTDDDLREILSQHDPDRRGWSEARSADDARIWTRNDAQVVAFTKDGMVLNVCDANDPPFPIPRAHGGDEVPGEDEQRPADPTSRFFGLDEESIEALSRRVIMAQADIALDSLDFREVREMTSPDGAVIVLVIFGVREGESLQAAGPDSDAGEVDVVMVEFNQRVGLSTEGGIVRLGRSHVSSHDDGGDSDR